MPELLHVGPLPPAPEIFFRDVSSILERRGSPLSIDFLSVFPFEGRSDGLAYDEKLFDKLFSRRERIRPVFRLDHPFRLPGREDWDSGLDEAGSEGLPFLAMRLASAVEDMGELAGGKFAGLMVVASAGESLDPARCSRLAEECGYDPESFICISAADLPQKTSAWPLLGAELWEEQTGSGEILGNGGLVRLNENWQSYSRILSLDALRRSRSLVNELRSQPRGDFWPFIPRGQGDPADPDVAFAELLGVCDEFLLPRSERQWYGEFRRSLEIAHRELMLGRR
jgi:hypothetical protein